MILLGFESRSVDRPYKSSLIRMTLSWAYALGVFAFAQICAKFDLLKVSALLILLSFLFAFAQICAKFDLLKVSALLILLSFLFHHAAAPQY